MDRYVAWVVGTWHASFLLVAFFAVAHAAGAAGDLAAGIGTMPGILAFAWLWLVSLWSARRALGLMELGVDAVAAAGGYGAAAGAVFVAGAGSATLLWAFVEQGGDAAALLVLPLVAIAAAVASLPGAVVGWILLRVDRALAHGIEVSLLPAERP